MKNIISFSGGKDSTALIIWAKENLIDEDSEVVFCDTGWEHDLTYEYINYINDVLLNGNLIKIKSKKYEGFKDLSIKKGRCPSVMARFCTEELKLKPMKDYIKKYQSNVKMYVGIRADESISRKYLLEQSYSDFYDCDIVRPLLKWSAEDCINIILRKGIKVNPLYKKGMKRVGCMPCIMISKPELKNIVKFFPDIKDKIKNLENEVGKTFFPLKYIPDRFCSKIDKNGVIYPECNDIFDYIQSNENQLNIFDEPECLSYYGICE